jgi:hypothetical protein
LFSEDAKSIKGSQVGDENGTKESQDARSSIAMVSIPLKKGQGGGTNTPKIGTKAH